MINRKSIIKRIADELNITIEEIDERIDEKSVFSDEPKFEVGDFIIIDEHPNNDIYPEPDCEELNSYEITDIMYSKVRNKIVYRISGVRNNSNTELRSINYGNRHFKKSCPVCGDEYITSIFSYDFGQQDFDDCVCKNKRDVFIHNK